MDCNIKFLLIMLQVLFQTKIGSEKSIKYNPNNPSEEIFVGVSANTYIVIFWGVINSLYLIFNKNY